MKFIQSEEFFNRARKIVPGGVNSPVRSFRSVGGKPFAVSKAQGPYLWDLDGNKFVDLVCSWGALIHGHNNERLQKSVIDAVRDGLSYGITCEREIELCDLITRSIPCMEMVRLVNSGTEACMSAIRLARGATGRDLILKFDGHYHGHGDSFLVAAGSGVAELPVSDSAGIPKHTLETTLVIPFNDRAALKNVFEKFGSRIGGVILEVVSGNMGVVLPDPMFLKELRDYTNACGSVLIFDEVMTGFRLSLQGAQGLYGINPDLMCLGKVIGGGMPVGAYGGSRKLMEKMAPLGPVYQAGTLSGNPVSCAAGIESLKIIREDEKYFYQNLDASSAEFQNQVVSHVRAKGYPVSVARAGSMLTIFFRSELPKNYQEARQVDIEKFKTFFWSLLQRGVYYPPSAFEACFISSVHDESVLGFVTDASLKALDEAFGG